jgi:LPXTG-motif cell wall-anchored protein
MTTMENQSAPLWTRGMIAVLSAQFLSAMADNASTPWSPWAGFGAALATAIGILWLRRRRLVRAVLNAL